MPHFIKYQCYQRGRFENGELVEAKSVNILAQRCRNGMKELMIRPSTHAADVKWIREEADRWHITKHALVMDPHERKSVYVGRSQVKGANEGLFARRDFLPGSIVSYFAGTRTFEKFMFFDNMTEEEETITAAYYFKLSDNSPEWWGYPDGLKLDIPEEFRSIYQYRTTLGHKANHMFKEKNTEYDTVDHPVHGGIVCLIATKPISKDEEVYVDYWYDVKSKATVQWYKDLYIETYGSLP